MKVAKKALVILLIAVAMELFIFNFQPVCDRVLGRENLNEIYTLADFETINWTETADGLISGYDPMLILDGVNTQVHSLRIFSDCLGQVPYVNVFYTNDHYLQFGDGPVLLEMVESGNAVEIAVNDTVENLRIDLGDQAGVALNQLTVIVNPSAIQISIARIVAIILIAFFAEFLFSLQRYPTYFSDSIETSSGSKDGGETGIHR